ncbi:diaminopropionate ammonia-lyase [Colwellia psychrerythraea]|uniref:Diaminopropionate ammonia-lyase n=1 Tax=Colwellia psychrerythraea TaxID=28229 RepID=A0A099L471_COLPS|nr:diaminopropionate ammonia-lyase [Colwellia psychrerythraea]KGJ96957.1 Diaminopropionate ammonia-lyase [Colwellia psychrerythraea]
MTEFKPNYTKPLDLLSACPMYKVSPLIDIQTIAELDLLIKDESHRMGLGSFKALGGIYAVATLLANKWLAETGTKLTLEQYSSSDFKNFSSATTFICASAGNHGLAVASGAKIFGAKAKIHLSEQVPEEFEKRLLENLAVVVRSGKTYEESVKAANNETKNGNGVLLADGSWQGYTYPPSLVMEGYTVIASELCEQFTQLKKWPTHVFIQAGVGGLAASMAYMIREYWKQQPEIIIVESELAPCLQTSHQNGGLTTVEGDVSIMGRLDCKAPSLVAFNTLESAKVDYITISDKQSLDATCILQENNILTTPSGAAGLAGLLKIYKTEKIKKLLSKGNFNPLIIVTENKL